MKKMALAVSLAAQVMTSATAFSAEPAVLSVKLDGIEDGKPIAEKFAFCAPDSKSHSKDGGNISPAISWWGAPSETKSFAVIVVDRDVPASFDNANKEGKTIPADAPRQDFYHWVLVDIPGNVTKLAEGVDSPGMTPGGKSPGKREYGIVGQNDYATFSMGKGGGYDGPCPPWNDERLHRYHFMVYALDTESLGLSGNFTGQQAIAAMQGHVLATGGTVGTYTQNPELADK
jgi:Raf kinase inhibitor-like YbhB/YbcL family protein